MGWQQRGYAAAELAHIADPQTDIKIIKARPAFCFQPNLTGGTTVATTMLISAAAGIHVFATGGIGGVHRGAEWILTSQLTCQN